MPSANDPYNIRWIRETFFGVTQGAFAREIEVPQSLVSRWESGIRIPGYMNMKAIREYAERVRAGAWRDNYFFDPQEDTQQ